MLLYYEWRFCHSRALLSLLVFFTHFSVLSVSRLPFFSLHTPTCKHHSQHRSDWMVNGLFQSTDSSKCFTTLVTFTHSHTHSNTDGRGWQWEVDVGHILFLILCLWQKNCHQLGEIRENCDPGRKRKRESGGLAGVLVASRCIFVCACW